MPAALPCHTPPAPPRIAMSTIKAAVSFKNHTAAKLSPAAQVIHDKMTLNAGIFDAPPVDMATFQERITDYKARLVARASLARADVMALKAARDLLEETLNSLGNYVNVVAKGDGGIVEKSGFPFYEVNRAPDTTPPGAPANLRLRHSGLPGGFIARYKPRKPNSTNEVQTCAGDPNNEADWVQKGIIKGGRAEITGFPPGAVVWARVRTLGIKNIKGVWSDPAQIRIL
ncbi:MAG TPA: hypothetical protein PK490_13080 [Prosthecobacter sp.]|nr:hypothetical protein [Prosthecobacter sp.]HRK15221.1 hypothetical protein [Prosthecobacter sp.]